MGTFVIGGVVVAAALAAGYLWLPAIGDPSAQALQHSLAEAAGDSAAGFAEPCEPYRLRMEDRRCWRARKVSRNWHEEGPPFLKRRTSGCVMWRNQLRLLDRLL